MHRPSAGRSPLAALWLAAAPAPFQDVAERATNAENGHAYVRTSDALTLIEADALARTMGGTLVSIGSAAEETFLLENFGASEGYWIGLEFPRETWNSGEKVVFAHWFTGEPSGGALEPFTVLNWGEPGGWGDTLGNAEKERYRALIEFETGAPSAVPALPARAENRGVLLLAIQDLAPKDLENARLPNLNELWKRSAWSFDAAADGSGDPLASLGLLAWGVGSPKSRLASATPKDAAQQTNENLLARLEDLLPRVTTASLLDDANASGVLMDGRIDLRVSNASPRKGGSAAPIADALARPTPSCLLASWTDLARGEGNPGDRAKDLAAIDQELGSLLATLRARPSFAAEEWWIALAGLAPEPVKLPKKPSSEDLRARTAVPLCLLAPALPPGEILAEVGLVDVLPSALSFLGVEPRRSFGFDGRALALERAPAFGANLVVNGDAEAQFGYLQSDVTLVTGWRQLGGFQIGRYPSPSLPGDPGPAARGLYFFQGKPEARLEQTLDLSALAADVDRGAVSYRLAAQLGFLKASPAALELALEFLNERKKPMERVELAPPEPGKKEAGLHAAGWTAREASGRVPRRARVARLVLTTSGGEDALADGIALVLARE
jgi:hypothetical protein